MLQSLSVHEDNLTGMAVGPGAQPALMTIKFATRDLHVGATQPRLQNAGAMMARTCKITTPSATPEK